MGLRAACANRDQAETSVMAWGARAAVTKHKLGQMLLIQGQMNLNLVGHGMGSTSTMHHTFKMRAALIPSGAYLCQTKTQRTWIVDMEMKTRWTWIVVIATMAVHWQPLERAVPQ